MRKEMSTLDAFIALDKIDRRQRRMNEAAVVDVDAPINREEINSKLKNDSRESELVIADANADSIEHLKPGSSYVGEYALKCNTCHELCFVKGDDEDPLNQDDNDPTIYNKEMECPSCHKTGAGFELVGQMQAANKNEDAGVEEPELTNDVEPEEAEADNDQAEGEEAMFDNDLDGEAESTEEEQPTDEVPTDSEIDTVEDDQEPAFDETDSVDDTADMTDDTFGEVPDENETAEDDTGTNFQSFDDIINDHRRKKAAKEGLEEDDLDEDETNAELEKDDEGKEIITEDGEEQQRVVECVGDFFDCISDPEHIKNCKYCGDQPYDGPYEEFPAQLRKAPFGGFDCGGDMLIAIVGDNATVNKLSDMLQHFIGDSDICVYNEDGDQVCYGDKDYVCKKCGDRSFKSFEVPSRVTVNGKANGDMGCNDEDALCASIYKANGMQPGKVNNIYSEENFVRESIYERDNLKAVYENYVQGKCSNRVVEKFKKVTGYKDEVDEAVATIMKSGRKDLAEALRNNTRPFKKLRHLKEGVEADGSYTPDYILPKTSTDVVPFETSDSTDVAPADPYVRDLMSRMAQISEDTVDAIYDNYKILIPKELVVADILQDLQLIGHQLSPEDLESTPMNELTKQMFDSYEDFYAGVNAILAAFGEEPITPDERLQQALDMLQSSPMFDRDHIYSAIASPRFLEAAQQGMIPYINPDQLQAPLTESNDNFYPQNLSNNDSISYATNGTDSIFCYEVFFNDDSDNILYRDDIVVYGKPSKVDVERYIAEVIEPGQTAILVPYDACHSPEEMPRGYDLNYIDDSSEAENVRPERDFNRYHSEPNFPEYKDPTEYDSSDEHIHEGVKHLKNRKELAEALKNNTKPFNISRSKLEGYRYDLKEDQDVDFVDDEDGFYTADELDSEVKSHRRLTPSDDLRINGVRNHNTGFDSQIDELQFDEDDVDYEDLEFDPDEFDPTVEFDPAEVEFDDIEFNSDDFDRDINEYFKQNYQKKAIYESRVGTYDEKGTIIVEGKLSGEKERHVRFTLTPNSDGSYRVTNNLSSEVFEYKK